MRARPSLGLLAAGIIALLYAASIGLSLRVAIIGIGIGLLVAAITE